MTQSTLVSIIVPVYNVEQYIEKCLQSLKEQTYQTIEVLLVDDQSPDQSSKIINRFCQQDSRFIALKTDKNLGLSGARNWGLNQAKGEYVCFVDSDDWVDPTFVEELLNSVTEGDMDMSACFPFLESQKPLKEKDINQALRNTNYVKTEKGRITFNDINHYMAIFPCYIWAFMFKKAFLDDHGLLFPEGLYYEDTDFFWKAISLSATGYKHTQKKLYHYRYQRPGAITVQNNKAIDTLDIFMGLEQFFKDHHLYNDTIKKNMDVLFFNWSGDYVQFALHGRPKEKKAIFLHKLTQCWQSRQVSIRLGLFTRTSYYLITQRPAGWRFQLWLLNTLRLLRKTIKG